MMQQRDCSEKKGQKLTTDHVNLFERERDRIYHKKRAATAPEKIKERDINI
jgi:hypothetical protein